MNIKSFSLVLFSVLINCSVLFGQNQPLEILYVGTYSERDSKGIYVFEMDRKTGELTEIQTVTDKKSPSFLETHPNKQFLYAAYREGASKDDPSGTITAFKIDQTTGEIRKINELSSEGAGPCHIGIDPLGRFVYVSNYGGGNLIVYPIGPNGSLGKPTDIIQYSGNSINESRQEAPHVHSAIPSKDGKYVYVSDLGTDKITIYEVKDSGKLKAAKRAFVKSKKGAGPRHFTIHQSGNYAYSVEELSSTIAAYEVDTLSGALSFVQRVDMLDESSNYKGQNSAADIHTSPNGNFLYASNRGQDNVVIFSINERDGKLKRVGHQSSGGNHPRNFSVEKDGMVIVANRDSDNVVVFEVDAATGMFSSTRSATKVPAAVCIQYLDL